MEVPTALLERAIASASTGKTAVEHTGLLNYVRSQSDTFDSRVRILIDSTLADQLAKPDERLATRVRVYDLDDPRTAMIRSKIKGFQTDVHSILLALPQ
jgi:hypothetical protein